MKKTFITLCVLSLSAFICVNAQTFPASYTQINTWGQVLVDRSSSGWMKFKVGGIANPRISGLGGKVVFYDSEAYAHNKIEVSSVLTASDARLKTNIIPISQGLSTILSLKPVQFNWKKDIQTKSATNVDYGFLAQDIMEIIPGAVEKSETGDLVVNYNAILPFLTQSIAELQLQIDDLRLQLDEKANKDEISTATEAILASKTALAQNVPNPFSGSTSISYTVPESTINASITICNIQGALIKKYDLHTKGKGTIHIQSENLLAGMYLYSLVVDGKIISTKRMLVKN